jgi:hypothetical protein
LDWARPKVLDFIHHQLALSCLLLLLLLLTEDASNPAFAAQHPAEIGDGDPEDHRGDQDESAYPSASSRFDAAVCGSIDKVRHHQRRIVMVRISSFLHLLSPSCMYFLTFPSSFITSSFLYI